MLVDTHVGRLFVEVVGQGPPVVLWHSLLCDADMWRAQRPVLGERWRLVLVDGPGHGRSARTDRPYNLDDCTEAAVQLLDALDVARAAWVGLSWGAMVGMRLAISRPERVGPLALLATSARPDPPWKLAGYRALAAVARRLGPEPPLGRLVVPLMFGGDTRRTRPELVERFLERLSRMDPRSLGHAVDAVVLWRDDVSGSLGRIRSPVLVMVGAEDRATPPSEARRLCAAIPGARLVVIQGAGHLCALERPEAVNAELVDFLGAHSW
ncbi:MAG: alpha/beta fold hydrolase [Myxococcales bacterium]|nr:alpha/beta fold hydrolase [Myxococcales bacterium]